ncbi:MAG: hypothetical protein JW841_11515, partial [Deltaproteobacteria bacterium]|nr:hypothetical protein [Deltaproteobacteria bacterium]
MAKTSKLDNLKETWRDVSSDFFINNDDDVRRLNDALSIKKKQKHRKAKTAKQHQPDYKFDKDCFDFIKAKYNKIPSDYDIVFFDREVRAAYQNYEDRTSRYPLSNPAHFDEAATYTTINNDVDKVVNHEPEYFKALWDTYLHDGFSKENLSQLYSDLKKLHLDHRKKANKNQKTQPLKTNNFEFNDPLMVRFFEKHVKDIIGPKAPAIKQDINKRLKSYYKKLENGATMSSVCDFNYIDRKGKSSLTSHQCTVLLIKKSINQLPSINDWGATVYSNQNPHGQLEKQWDKKFRPIWQCENMITDTPISAFFRFIGLKRIADRLANQMQKAEVLTYEKTVRKAQWRVDDSP